jgi:ATP-dependent DNA helicase RecG
VTLADVEALIARSPKSDEWVDLEFKKTTAEREAAMETLCAFLNGRGGTVLFGVTPAGKVVGQDVSDGTVREVAALFQHLEPGAMVEQHRVPVGDGGKELLVLSVTPLQEQ